MRTRRHGRRMVAVIMTFAATVPMVASAAAVGLGSSSAAASTARTAVWSVTSGPTATTTATGLHTYSVSVDTTGTAQPAYFWLRNSGSLVITGFTVTQTLTNVPKLGTVTLAACSVAWNTTSGTCAGATTTLITTLDNGSSSAAVRLALNVGQAVHVRALPATDKKNSAMQDTVSIAVSRADARTPITINS